MAFSKDRTRVSDYGSRNRELTTASAKLGSLRRQRFTTKKRHGFRFDLAQTARRRLIIGNLPRLYGLILHGLKLSS